MANNRLFLRCKRTGEKVLLAKYYPSTGWYVSNEDLVKALDEMFHRDDFAAPEGDFARGGIFDGGAHELVYDEPADKET